MKLCSDLNCQKYLPTIVSYVSKISGTFQIVNNFSSDLELEIENASLGCAKRQRQVFESEKGDGTGKAYYGYVETKRNEIKARPNCSSKISVLVQSPRSFSAFHNLFHRYESAKMGLMIAGVSSSCQCPGSFSIFLFF
jgi:hypothetical protein